MASMISCSSTSVIAQEDYPRMGAVVQVIDDKIYLEFPAVEPIVMSRNSGSALLTYITNLKDWGLYHAK
jgi:hypothetical protein